VKPDFRSLEVCFYCWNV